MEAGSRQKARAQPEKLPALAKAIAKEIIKLRNRVNLFHCGVQIVGHPAKMNPAGIIQHHITRTGIEVTRLANGSHIAHDFLVTRKECEIKLIRGLKVELVGV